MTTDKLTPTSLDPDNTRVQRESPARPGPSIFSVASFVIPTLVILGFFVVLTNHAKNPLGNADTYFHLRFGEEFLNGTWSLRHPGTVTTFGTEHWLPTQWLPQVVLAQVEDWFGLAGVAWVAGLLYLALAVTLWLSARRFAGPLVTAPVVVIAVMAASGGISMRPQLISCILVTVTVTAWLSTRDDGRVRWWLVPTTWLWAMVHGFWPIGIVIGVVGVVGIGLDRAVDRRTWFKLASIPILSAVVAALTPVGPSLYGAVLIVNSRGKYFAEWAAPDFKSGDGAALLVLAGVVLLRLARSRPPRPWTEVLLFVLAGGLALYTSRTGMVAAMMLVPLTALSLQSMLPARPRISRLELGTVLGGAAACLAVLAVLVPRTADEPPPDPDWYATAVDALPPGTVVLNDWGQGGYLMWRFPQLDLVMNGYGDIFTDAEIDRNYVMDGTLPGWLDDVERTGAEYALLKPDSRLSYSLRTLEGWTVTHTSADMQMLEAPPDWPSHSS